MLRWWSIQYEFSAWMCPCTRLICVLQFTMCFVFSVVIVVKMSIWFDSSFWTWKNMALACCVFTTMDWSFDHSYKLILFNENYFSLRCKCSMKTEINGTMRNAPHVTTFNQIFICLDSLAHIYTHTHTHT